MTIYKILGENIRQKRKALGLSQAKLGEAAGLTIQAINRIEKSKSSARSKNLDAIARALGCQVDDLIEKPNSSAPPMLSALAMAQVILQQQLEIEELKRRIAAK